MSANIYFKAPLRHCTVESGVFAPQAFIELLEETFGSFEKLDEGALPVLKGLEVATSDPLFKKAFETLTNIILDKGSVRIVVEY